MGLGTDMWINSGELSFRLGFTAITETKVRWARQFCVGSLSEEQGSLMNLLASSSDLRCSRASREAGD